MFRKFIRDDKGGAAIEYGLINAAVGVALVAIPPVLAS